MPTRAPADRTQQLIDALSSPVRREILWLVWDREMTAGEISGSFALSAPTISSHLAVLRESGLISMTRDGTFRRYRARHDEVRALRELLGPRADAPVAAPDAPPPVRASEPRATTRLLPAAVVEVEAPCTAEEAFRAFTDPVLYSRWAGVAVAIVDGRFAATMEWGLQVRGRYELVVPPRLLVMRWDYADDAVPLPGAAQRGYLEVTPTARGCRVTVSQLAADGEAGGRMGRAWSLMLARFRDHVADALDAGCAMPLRAPTAP